MLKRLSIENYALIESLELDFSDSLNIITGETGAGKSILLGALALLLGERASVDVVKDVGRNCVVEALFDIENYDLEWFFDQNDLDYSHHTTIRRVISPAGKSRAYINDLPVQLTPLREFSLHLIDIHSQHQSLMISEDGFRIATLDSVAKHRALLDRYSHSFGTLRSTERELVALKEAAQRSEEDREWLVFQLEQLESAQLKGGELVELERSQQELSNADEIKRALTLSAERLSGDESGILLDLSAIEGDLGSVARYYPQAEELVARIHSARLEMEDIERELASEGERMESDPTRLSRVEERLNTIYSLQQRYKVSNVEELIELKAGYRLRLDDISGSEEAILKLESRVGELTKESIELAAQITKGRTTAAGKLTKHIESMLADLGMVGGRFEVEIVAAKSLRSSGADDIRFLFSGNTDIKPAPIEQIASGGEISRVMLALKSMVAQSSNLPTIIFDEIDSGVSGRIADAMGRSIAAMSESMQVINITHLPQVASKGKTHLYVYKESGPEGSRTMIRTLNMEERIVEIAKMLSGSTTTDAATAQARILLGLPN